ncbi:MAG: lipopolysaccharide biosynthesis protein [Bacteroidaceae bacterium]|nr:lipopolysaccharide biosynthesis protein [Bacteroidaceae bacterium]
MSTGKQVTKNIIWKYIESYSHTGIQLLTTFILARFLSPSDYGIMGMVVVFSSFANVIIDSGFGQALIREKEVTKTDYSTILYFNLLVSLLLYLLLYMMSGVIADFYNQEILNDVCKVTFLALPLSAISIVQSTKLQKEIRFKKLCIITLISSLLSCIITIILAYIYRNVWALVFQGIIMNLLKAILLWLTGDFIPNLKFSVNSLKKYFGFSKNLLISGLIGTFFNNIYTLTIGKIYTPAELGFYSQAYRVKSTLSITMTSVVQSVTYPILAKINNETGDIREAYKKIICITLMCVGLLMALFMGCACDIFELLMGNKIWRVAGTFFILLGINGILFPLHSINQNILMVKGDSRTVLLLEIIRRGFMILVIAITSFFDIHIFILGLSIYSIILLFPNLYFCGKPINYTIKEQLKDCLPIFTRLAIIISVQILTNYLTSDIQIILRVAISLTAGCITAFIMFRNYIYFKLTISLLKSISHR